MAASNILRTNRRKMNEHPPQIHTDPQRGGGKKKRECQHQAGGYSRVQRSTMNWGCGSIWHPGTNSQHVWLLQLKGCVGSLRSA